MKPFIVKKCQHCNRRLSVRRGTDEKVYKGRCGYRDCNKPLWMTPDEYQAERVRLQRYAEFARQVVQRMKPLGLQHVAVSQ